MSPRLAPFSRSWSRTSQMALAKGASPPRRSRVGSARPDGAAGLTIGAAPELEVARIERPLGVIVGGATGPGAGNQHLGHARRQEPHAGLEARIQFAVFRPEPGLPLGILGSNHLSKFR